MYSPQIREDLIPRIYHAAKRENIPMTIWVDRAVERELTLNEQIQEEESGIVAEGGMEEIAEQTRSSP